MKYYTIKDPIGSILFFIKSYSIKNKDERKSSVISWFNSQSPYIPEETKEAIYLEFSEVLNLDIDIVDRIFIKLGYQTFIVTPLFEENSILLEKSGLIYKESNKYRLTQLGLYLFENGNYKEYIKSTTYKANFWKRNNVKITDNENIGSGSFIEKNVIVTCKHVLDDLTGSPKIEDENGKSYTIKSIKKHPNENVDLLKITTNEDFDYFTYSIENTVVITEKVIVFGYPPIPLSSKPFLVANLGEVSSLVDNYLDKTDCLILSCIARPGNSGGPIVNEYGKLIGIVIQNRHYKFSPTLNDMKDLDVSRGLGYGTGIMAKYINEF